MKELACCKLATFALHCHDSDCRRVPIDDVICVEEVADADFFAGDLFRRRFGSAPPDFPAHLVAFHRPAANCFVTMGYLHVSRFDDLWLCGGLAVDERAVRRMPGPQQAALRAGRDIARRLVDAAAERFASAPALWAMAGDAAIREVFHGAKFAAASAPNLMVRWNDRVDAAAREDLLRRAIAFGPF